MDSGVDVGMKIIFGLDDKKLGEISLKRKEQEKTFATMKKSLKVGETVVQISSDQLRLLASVARDEGLLLEIFSHKLSGIALLLFHDNGEMRKAELMNEISAILFDVLTESAFHVIDWCAWFYQISWAKVGNIKDLYSFFQQTSIKSVFCSTGISLNLQKIRNRNGGKKSCIR